MDVQETRHGRLDGTMGTVHATITLQRASAHWRVRLACALVITVVVGLCSYALTYRALVVISTPSGAATTVPGPSYPVTPSTATPVASLPGR